MKIDKLLVVAILSFVIFIGAVITFSYSVTQVIEKSGGVHTLIAREIDAIDKFKQKINDARKFK